MSAYFPVSIAHRKPVDSFLTVGSLSTHEGPEILAKAAQTCTPLRDALEVWKDITFNYESTDSPEFVPTATPAM